MPKMKSHSGAKKRFRKTGSGKLKHEHPGQRHLMAPLGGKRRRFDVSDGIHRLRHVMRYSRQHSTICNTLTDAGWFAGVGAKWGVDPREMAESDLIVVWGGNPVNTQVNVMTHIARARKSRGARLVVVDPYRTGTAEQADLHVMLRPGSDGALASAMMHVLFAEGMADRAYLARFAKDWEAFERHLETRTPEWAAPITGISADAIRDFARLYGRTERAYIRLGYGFARTRNGAANMHAVSCLPTVAGKWRHRGGGALYGMAGLYHVDKTLIEGLDALDKSTRLLDQSRLGPILTGDRRDLGDGPQIHGLFVQNTNPMAVCPETLKVKAGFLRDDLFTVVHEQFMTETAAMADIVLPATTFLEHADLYVAGGHTHLYVTRPVIEPFAEARSNHWVLCELAKRLGARHRGFDMDEWAVLDETLRVSGYPGADAVADGRWIDVARIEILPTVDPRSHTATARLYLPDNIEGVVPGAYARAHFTLGQAKKMTVPPAAVLRRGEVTAVYVLDDKGAARLRQVRLGEAVAGGELEVLAARAIARDLIVVCDEVYEHLVFDGRRHRPLMTFPGMRERTLRIGSAGNGCRARSTMSAEIGIRRQWAVARARTARRRAARRCGIMVRATPRMRLRSHSSTVRSDAVTRSASSRAAPAAVPSGSPSSQARMALDSA